MENKYKVYVDCSNCGERDQIEIEKGKTIEEQHCPNCGCDTLERV